MTTAPRTGASPRETTGCHRRRSARCLRLSLLLVLFLTTGVGQEQAFTQSDFWFTDELQPYRALVDAHRARRTQEAIQGVLAFDPEVIHALIDRVRDPDARPTGTDAKPALNELLFRAAAMLQLDVADSLWSRGLEEAASDWIEVAVRWIELGARDPEPEQSFRRRWYLAATLLAFERGGWSDGVTFSEVALERLPDDVPLLTAAAWLNEGLALEPVILDNTGTSQLARIQQAKRSTLLAAARRAGAALAVSPSATEAALRLARIRMLLEQGDSVRALLTGLVDRENLGVEHAYVARLLLGDLHRHAGELDAAEQRWREAVDLIPDGQAARMALARLLHTRGDVSGAARTLTPTLDPAASSAGRVPYGAAAPRGRLIAGLPDPWVDYQLGIGAGPGLREELRLEVRP
jgi:tetratricopeptide (TPR) repeat protein